MERAHVPDDYDDLKRTVGIYPVFSLAFFEFSKKWQKEATDMFQQTAAGTLGQQDLTRYQPPDIAVPAKRIAAIFANAKTDALGIPQFGDRESETLFATFAPVFEIETTGEYDRFGPLRWGAGETPEVDVSRPTAYRRLAFTRYGGRHARATGLHDLVSGAPAKQLPGSAVGKARRDRLSSYFESSRGVRSSMISFTFAAATTCFSLRHWSNPFRRRTRKSNGLSFRARCP